ncbi:MAG TPA: hypothetical protein VHF22_05905 [Planctomycetota bacterium]|nr:hypothetical protein [Planctomycetota bacterium]
MALRSDIGLELAIGNRDGANGHTFDRGRGDRRSAIFELHPLTSERERAELVRLGELAYMRRRRDEALAWIEANPGRFAALTLTRARLFFFPPAEDLDGPWPVRRALQLAASAIAAAALLGALRRLGRRHRGALAGLAVAAGASPYLVTHIHPRYRAPFEGLLALLAADLALAVASGARRTPAPGAPASGVPGAA